MNPSINAVLESIRVALEQHDTETKTWIRKLKLGKADAAKVRTIRAEYVPDTASSSSLRAGKSKASGWNLTLADGYATDEGRDTSYANDLDELLALIQDAQPA